MESIFRKPRNTFKGFLFSSFLTLCFTSLMSDRYDTFQKCLRSSNANFSGKIVKRGSKLYCYYNYQWNLYPYIKTPFAYVIPQSESEVGIIIKCGVLSNISIVPKSGGHSFEKYSSGTSRNNVIIDLRRLKSVELKGNEAIVGSGTLSGYLNWNLWNIGKVMIPAGECPTVGIAGLTLGGGYNALVSRSFGLTSDVLTGMKIVTSTGELLEVNQSMHSDLFWALRGGGGGNFGIVTQFTFSTIQPPKITVGKLQYSMEYFPKLFQIFQHLILPEGPSIVPNSLTLEMIIRRNGIIIEFFDTNGFNKNSQDILKLFPPGGSNFSIEISSYIDTIFNRIQIIQFYYRFKPNVKLENPSDLTRLNRNSHDQTFHKRNSFFVYQKIGKSCILKLHDFLKKMPSTQSIFLQAFGGAINKYSRTETAFVHRGNSYAFVFPVSLQKNVSNPIHKNVLFVYQQQLNELSNTIFKYNETYQNYMQGNLSDYGIKFYGENLERLIKIKNKYDPTNYFKFPQGIP